MAKIDIQKGTTRSNRRSHQKREEDLEKLQHELPLFGGVAYKEDQIKFCANLVDYFNLNDKDGAVRGAIRSFQFQIDSAIALQKRSIVVKRLIDQIDSAVERYAETAQRNFDMLLPVHAMNISMHKKPERIMRRSIILQGILTE